MKALINHISDGKYFSSKDKIEIIIEDMIADIIDQSEFNLACQIESEFVNYELDRVGQILSGLEDRSELQELIEDLNNLSKEIKIIDDDNGER